MKESDREVVRAWDYRVLYTDLFEMATNTDGVRLQVQQQDPNGHVSELVGLQMSHTDAIGLAKGILKALDAYEERTGNKLARPEVEMLEKESS